MTARTKLIEVEEKITINTSTETLYAVIYDGELYAIFTDEGDAQEHAEERGYDEDRPCYVLECQITVDGAQYPKRIL